MTLEVVAAQLVAGISSACFLLLVSLGVSLVFGTARVFNFAHGGLFVVGGYCTCEVMRRFEWTFLPAGLFALAIAVVVSAVLYVVVFWRGRGAGADETQIVGSYGALLVVVESVRLIAGSGYVVATLPEWLNSHVGFMGIARYQVFLLSITAALVFGIIFAVKRTKAGRMIRAVVSDPWLAEVSGIRSEWVIFLVFVFGSALAALAGVVYVGRGALTPSSGDDLIVSALAVTLLGGRGNIKGACVASLILGQVSAFGVVLAPRLASSIPYAVAVALLAIRPAGLLRAETSSALERRV